MGVALLRGLLLALLASSASLGALAPIAAAQAAPTDAPPSPGTCQGATCAWALDDPAFPVRLEPGVSEVAPASSLANGTDPAGVLTLAVRQAGRAGTFYLSTAEPIPAPSRGTLSVWLRSEGDLARFPLLIREEGYPGWQERPEAGDAVFFAPASDAWRFVSFPWSPRMEGTTHVRIAFRGELAAGASAAIHLSDPYFGPDATAWHVDGGATPFAYGPRAGHRFDRSGDHVVRAVPATGAPREFRVQGPLVSPEVDLGLFPSPTLPGGVRAVAEGAGHDFQPERLRNGAFARGIADWRLDPAELGAAATMRADGDALRLDVPRTPQESSVWAVQGVAWTPGVLHEFVWRAHDDWSLLRYELVVLEADGTRHLSTAAPGGEWGAGGAIRFRPNASAGEVQLRAVFAANASGTVWFDRVSLREAFRYAWTLDGRAVGADAPLLDLAVDRAAPRVLGLRVTDARGVGATLNRSLAPGFSLGEPALRVRDDPRAGLVGTPLALDLTPSLAGPFDALATPAPWAGWDLEDAEAPGRVRLHLFPEGARVAFDTPGTQTAGAGVQRILATPWGGVRADLALRYRTEGPVERVEAIVRHHVPGRPEYVESRVNLTPSEDFRSAVLAVPAARPDQAILLVGLRAVVPEGETGSATFADVTLTPASTYEWRGAQGRGPLGTLTNATPGVHAWSVRVRAPGGLVLEREGLVGLTPPLAPHATLAAGVAAEWPADRFPEGVTLLLDGPADAAAPAAAGRVATATFAPGNYSVWATTEGGQRLLLGHRVLRDRASLPAAQTWNASRGTPLDLAFDLPHPRLASAHAVLSVAGRQAEVPLQRDADGTWRGTWDPPISWAPGEVSVALRLADDEGATALAPVGAVSLGASAGRPEGAAVLLAVLAVAVGAAWVPREAWTRRGRDAWTRAAIPLALDALAGALAGAAVAGVAFRSVSADAPFAMGALFAVAAVAGSVALRAIPRRARTFRPWAEPALLAALSVGAALALLPLAGHVAPRPAVAIPLLLAQGALAFLALLGARRLLRARLEAP